MFFHIWILHPSWIQNQYLNHGTDRLLLRMFGSMSSVAHTLGAQWAPLRPRRSSLSDWGSQSPTRTGRRCSLSGELLSTAGRRARLRPSISMDTQTVSIVRNLMSTLIEYLIAACFTANKRFRNKIITGSRDRTIRVWDAHYPWSCQKIIGPPPGDLAISGPVNNPAQQAAGKSPFATICPPSTPPAGIVAPMKNPSDYHSASILCLKFDEEIMVTGSSDFSCIVWDIKKNYRPIHRLIGHSAGVLDVCFDDRYIVSCSKDTSICVWDRKTGALLKQLSGHTGPVNAVQLRGDLVVSASGDGVAKLWNVTSGHCIKEFPSKDRGLACVEFSDDGRTILTGGNDKTIYQFDANTGEMVDELRGHSSLIRSLHLDSMNKRIVSASYDMTVKVFDTETGKLSIDLPGWTTSWMLNVQSDYRRIVATSQDSRTVIMDFGYGLDGIDLLEE